LGKVNLALKKPPSLHGGTQDAAHTCQHGGNGCRTDAWSAQLQDMQLDHQRMGMVDIMLQYLAGP
jgi:hypothetical protein